MRFPVAGLVALSAFGATAQTADGGGCLKVENDLDRLACYDRASGRAPTIETTPTASKWTVQKKTSALTDESSVYLSVPSNEVVDCGWNRGQEITLALRCMENKTALFFDTGCHMTSSDYTDYGDVTLRIDDTPAKTVGMEASTNNRALGLWSGGRSIPVIKQMIGAERLIVRMTPFSESPFTATFDIRGLEQEIGPLREACSW